jgi:RNA polymerase primary sigma factor
MALPLLFMLAGTLVRAATPTIARAIAQRGAKKIAESGIKGAIKKYGKPKNITSLSRVKNMKGSGASAAAKEVMKKFPVPKNKSLTIPKPKSNVGAKIVAGGATAITGAAALGSKDKGKAKADVKTPTGVSQGSTTAKKKPTTMPKGVSQGSTAGTATTMTFGKAFRAAKDAGKKEFTYRGKRYNTRTKDEEKAMAKNQPLPKARPKTTTKKKKVETPKNVSQGSTTAKKEAPKKSKGFLERFKEDFNKAVKETKRNFEGDAKKGTGRYKSVSTGKTNFNTKKKKAS